MYRGSFLVLSMSWSILHSPVSKAYIKQVDGEVRLGYIRLGELCRFCTLKVVFY